MRKVLWLILMCVLLAAGCAGSPKEKEIPSTSFLSDSEVKVAREVLKDQWQELSAEWAPYSGRYDTVLTEDDFKPEESFIVYELEGTYEELAGKSLREHIGPKYWYWLKVAPRMIVLANADSRVPSDMRADSRAILPEEEPYSLAEVQKTVAEQFPGKEKEFLFLGYGFDKNAVLVTDADGKEWLMSFDRFLKDYGIEQGEFYPAEEVISAIVKREEESEANYQEQIKKASVVLQIGDKKYMFNPYDPYSVRDLPEGWELAGYIREEDIVQTGDGSVNASGCKYYANPKENRILVYVEAPHQAPEYYYFNEE